MFFWDAGLDFRSALCFDPCLVDICEEVFYLFKINKRVLSWSLGALPLLILFFLLSDATCLPCLFFFGMPRGGVFDVDALLLCIAFTGLDCHSHLFLFSGLAFFFLLDSVFVFFAFSECCIGLYFGCVW